MSAKKNSLDPRVKRTRDLIQKSFFDLLGEKGFDAITVGDIAARATVNRATFYAHFRDKYELFDHSIRESFQQELSRVFSSPAEFSFDSLRLLVLTVANYIFQQRGHNQSQCRQFGPLIKDQVQKQLYEFLLTWIEPLPLRDSQQSSTPEITAMVTSWAILGAVMQTGERSRKESREKMADQVSTLILGGLSHAVGVALP